MSFMQTDYNFTDRERLFFDRLQQQFNTSVVNGIQMIVTQQDLQGQWRMKADGSGIERADIPQLLPPDSDFKAEVRKKNNGLA
jgi:predicted secreted protein